MPSPVTSPIRAEVPDSSDPRFSQARLKSPALVGTTAESPARAAGRGHANPCDGQAPVQMEPMANSEVRSWLTASQTAHRLNISKRTMYRLVQDGKLPQPTKHGRSARWSLTLLMETESRWQAESRAAQERQKHQ